MIHNKPLKFAQTGLESLILVRNKETTGGHGESGDKLKIVMKENIVYFLFRMKKQMNVFACNKKLANQEIPPRPLSEKLKNLSIKLKLNDEKV